MSLENSPSFLLNFSEFDVNVEEKHFYQFKSFRLDVEERQLLHNGNSIPLTPKAFEVLAILVERNGHLVEKDELLRIVWADSFVEEANVARIIHTLRKALGEDKNGNKFIETVAKKGYRFIAELQVSENYLINPTVEHTAKNGDGLAIKSASQTNKFVESEFAYKNEDELKNYSVGSRKLSRKFIAVCFGVVLIAAMLSLGFYKFSKTANTSEPFRQINLSRLTNYGNVGKVALSPDGNLIAYETGDKDGVSLWVRQIEMSNAINLVPSKKGNFTFLTFSPDGKLIYYGLFSGDKIAAQFYSVPALGGASRKLPIVVTTWMSFAPDGKHFAHITTDSGAGEKILLISSLDGGEQIELAKSKMPLSFNVEGQSCAWSPDGKTIAVIKNVTDAEENFSTVVGISPTDGAEKPLSAKRWISLNSVQWLKDDSGLLVIGSDTPQGSNQIWFVSAADGEARMLTNDLNDYSYIGAAANGKQFVSVQESRTSSVWIGAVAQNSNDFKELISETGKLDSIVSTANGSIVFRSNAGGNSNLWTIGVDGKKRQITVDGQVEERGLCAAPVGNKIVFPSRQAGKVNLWSMTVDGGEMKQLTDGDGEFYPVCTPDDSSVIYQKGYGFGVKSTLWKISLEGGEPVRLTDYFAMRPTVSPDGSRVAFFYMSDDTWRIGLVSSGGGAIEQSLAIPDGVSDRLMRWSPDGQSLLYMSNAGETGNIWKLPLDGSPQQQVTNFDSQMVEDFSLTPNGRQIFVTRTTALSDVINVSEK
jgi:DNA-binding winged helix-turn-helix (wHTH) protein/Tol biopolymer transport system component